jgi:hypothetical protein
MHPAPAMKNNDYVTFDLKNNAIVLPKDPGAYVANGFTTQAILTNLKNLGAKFETPQQAGLPSSGISNSMANIMPRLGFAYALNPNDRVIVNNYAAALIILIHRPYGTPVCLVGAAPASNQSGTSPTP